MQHDGPAISILVISFNTRQLTLDCLKSIYEQTRTLDYEVIVVDNASGDGSAEAIAAAFPQVDLVASQENLGFARANNIAAERARGKYLLLLNPDTVVQNGTLHELLDFAERNPSARIWGGRTTFADGTINPSCLGDMSLWSIFCRACGLTYLFPHSRLFNPEYVHMWDRLDRERDVDIVVGCFLLIDKLLWDKLGGFNPDFFMYGEEVDLCLRARKQGASPRITPRATIIHHGGCSEPSTEDKLVKILRGRITLMKMHWCPLTLLLARWILLVTVAVRAAASKIIHPPQRRGAGLDRRANVWGAVFRRRGEWLAGWPITCRL